MVFVKVRETYDLHTVKNKMTVIGIHTPNPAIIKSNFPGLLMQCKAYRPVSCDVRVACASTLPLDPLGVGVGEGDVAPEDLFNPILYSAMSNFGMSQLESRINYLCHEDIFSDKDVAGVSVDVDVDTVTSSVDEFPVYYGLLSNAHGWKHANPQAGLEMKGLKPLVYEMLYNVGDNGLAGADVQANNYYGSIQGNGSSITGTVGAIRGNAKPLPFINCTSFDGKTCQTGFQQNSDSGQPLPYNSEATVPWINCVVAGICIPPSRLHELFYRMVIEWTIEFSQIRSVSEITDWSGLGKIANLTHYQNYSYEATKKALGVEGELMDHDQTMVSANVEINKVM